MREEISSYQDENKDSGFSLFSNGDDDVEGTWLQLKNPTYLVDVEEGVKNISLFIPHEIVKELIDAFQMNVLRRYDALPITCIKPMLHKPQFEGKYNCKRCAIEHEEEDFTPIGDED